VDEYANSLTNVWKFHFYEQSNDPSWAYYSCSGSGSGVNEGFAFAKDDDV